MICSKRRLHMICSTLSRTATAGGSHPFFQPLAFRERTEAFILAPVAVHGDYQGKGIGQALIDHGLKDLKDRGVRLVLSYGDPRFHQKVGFRRISHEVVRAPSSSLSRKDGLASRSLVIQWRLCLAGVDALRP